MTSGVRERPADFRARYIELGKPGCEMHYRAHWKTIDRWVEEEGKSGLRAERAAWVAKRRALGAGAKSLADSPRLDDCPPDADDLQAACQYLRENRNGGWRVGLRDDGNYFVGTRNLVGSEVVAMAVAKGMDEWYVENDIRKRIMLEDGIDEWVLDTEATR